VTRLVLVCVLAAAACRSAGTTVRYVGPAIGQCAAGRAYQPPPLGAPTQEFIPIAEAAPPPAPAAAPEPPAAAAEPEADAEAEPEDKPVKPVKKPGKAAKKPKKPAKPKKPVKEDP
jgi:hypothetical protein